MSVHFTVSTENQQKAWQYLAKALDELPRAGVEIWDFDSEARPLGACRMVTGADPSGDTPPVSTCASCEERQMAAS